MLQKYVHDPSEINSLYTMIIAEGTTFIILLNIVLISVFILLRKEQTKFFTLQKFYAIFSHELKTPLTTMQLQLEVLPENLKRSPVDQEKIETIIKRMTDSTTQLKYEVEKILTLSQLELAPHFPLEKINLFKFLSQWKDKQLFHKDRLNISMDGKIEDDIISNYNLLEIIFNNLFRNSIKHTTDSIPVNIKLEKLNPTTLKLTYSDQGKIANLNVHKLGTLFYKSEQSNGSGLGLYIITQMMIAMNGKVKFDTSNNQLNIELFFRLDN
jgi:signal transduction histidine kinase